MKRGAQVLVALCFLCTAVPGQVRAENPEFNADDFVLSPHAGDLPGTMTTNILGPLEFSAGMALQWRKAPVVARDPDTGKRLNLVDGQLAVNLYGALPLFDTLSIGLDVPLLLSLAGDDPPAAVSELSGVGGAGLGDIRFSAKVRALEVAGFGFGLAQELSLPTATGNKYFGEAAAASRTLLVADYAWHRWIGALNAGYLVRRKSGVFAPPMEDEVFFSLGAQFPVWADRVDVLLTQNVRTLAGQFFADDKSTGATFRGGVRGRLWEGLVLTGATGVGMGKLLGTARWEMILMVGWESE